MKILIITATYPPSANGVAISTARTVQALRSLGNQVGIVGPNIVRTNDRDYFPLPTIRIPFFGLKDYPIAIPKLLPTQMQTIREEKWDIIHVHHPFMFGDFAIWLGKEISAQVVFTYHTQYDKYIEALAWLPRGLKKIIYDKFVLRVLDLFDGVIATTKWLRNDLRKIVKDGKRVYYVSTAGLLHDYHTSASLQEAKSRTNLNLETPIFLCVSRLSAEKKADILLRAFFSWADRHEVGNLVVIGDGSYRSGLEAMAKLHPQGSRVLFLGKIPNENLSFWYSLATVFLYSSITDTIGINIIEAMSAGLPVVAPRHITTEEVIKNDYNGILTDSSPQAMGEGMQAAVIEKERLSIGAYRTSQGYDAMRLAKRLMRVYADIIGKQED